MQLLVDFLPVLLFFAAYQLYGIYVATVVAMVASLLQVGVHWLRHRRVERLHLATLAMLVLLGGTTLLLQDEQFIQWKPTVVNWLFAALFLGSHFIGKQTLSQRMLGGAITLPASLWRRLNLGWVFFFALSGALNLYVAHRFDTDTWVNFKLFGMLGLTLVFVLAQGLYLGRHAAVTEEKQ